MAFWSSRRRIFAANLVQILRLRRSIFSVDPKVCRLWMTFLIAGSSLDPTWRKDRFPSFLVLATVRSCDNVRCGPFDDTRATMRPWFVAQVVSHCTHATCLRCITNTPGGLGGNRTPDILRARQMLSQLSYKPETSIILDGVLESNQASDGECHQVFTSKGLHNGDSRITIVVSFWCPDSTGCPPTVLHLHQRRSKCLKLWHGRWWITPMPANRLPSTHTGSTSGDNPATSGIPF